jgi:hypothetical protein
MSDPQPISELQLRLTMTPKLTPSNQLDGAWWPRSADLTIGLPPLIEAITKRIGRVRGILLNPAEWQVPPPDWTPAGDRPALISWSRRHDPHAAVLISENDRRIELVVVPPQVDQATADKIVELASTEGNTLTASRALMIARARRPSSATRV